MRRRSGVATTGKGRLGTDQRGIILVVTLMVVLILALLGTAFLTTSGTEHQIAKNDQEIVQALYVAEGGLQTAMNQLNQNLLVPPATVTGVLVAAGEYTVTVTPASPPDGQQRIEATGYVPTQAAPRAVKQIAVLVSRPSPFQWALFGDGALSNDVALGGTGGFVDSYDSAIGPYGGSNISQNGDVGSNGTIVIQGTEQVRGNATAGGIVDTTKSDLPIPVTGTVTEGAPIVTLPDVDCPAGGYTASAPSGPGNTGITYNPSTGVLTVNGGNITLTPGPWYFNSFSLNNGSTLTIEAGGRVDLYISNVFFAKDGAVINNSNLPSNLTIWGCGTIADKWEIKSGTTASYVAIYAPHQYVQVNGGGELWGAIIADHIKTSGGAHIHYDKALGRQPGGSGKFSTVLGSWTELAL